MSRISKNEYIECLSRMIDMTNAELKTFQIDSFISTGIHDESLNYYRIVSIKMGMCSIKRSLFSTTIETLVPPSLIVEPIAQLYFGDWRSIKGQPLKDMIKFSEGGQGATRGISELIEPSGWIAPRIEPFFRWKAPMRGETGKGRIEQSGGTYDAIRKVDNIEIVEVLNNVKLSEKRRAEEAERRKLEQLAREQKAQTITTDIINDLLNSI